MSKGYLVHSISSGYLCLVHSTTAGQQHVMLWKPSRGPILLMMQEGNTVIVMAKVLGILWMRNPLAILYQKEHQAPVPACLVQSGQRQPESSKKGDALRAALPSEDTSLHGACQVIKSQCDSQPFSGHGM